MPISENPVPVGGSLTAKGRATRARIVEKAAELMYRDGVSATSTEAILCAADVSNSQLYHYFADKADLIHAVIAHQIEQVVGRNEALLSQMDSLAALDRWRDALVTFASRPDGQGGCPVGALASELAEVDEPGRVLLAAGMERWRVAIREGLNKAQRRGQLRADADPEYLALATLAAVQGGSLLTQARRDSEPLKAGLDAAIGYIHTFAS